MESSMQHLDVAALLTQLGEAREKLREERATIKPKLAEADRKLSEAQATHTRARKAATRYLKRVRGKANAELEPIAAAKRELTQQQEELNRAFGELSDYRRKIEAQSGDFHDQVQQSWELLSQQQRQLAADRENVEKISAQRLQLLETREKELDAREKQFKGERSRNMKEVHLLRAELIGLEQRVASTRLHLQELEQLRLTATPLPAVPEVVAWVESQDGANDHTRLLEQQAQELALERRAIDRARTELDKLTEHLSDQRQVLAEQYQSFAATKIAWQQAESHTIEEIEDIVKAVEQREVWLGQERADVRNTATQTRDRERELWNYQGILDRWHTSLLERESQLAVERESAEVGLAARRGVVADREAGLDFVCQQWEMEHNQTRTQLLDEMRKWIDDRKACTAAIQSCEQVKRQSQEQAVKLAGWLLAIEQQQQEQSRKPESKKAARRVAALKVRWEKRFERILRKLDEQRGLLDRESRTLDERRVSFQSLLAQVTEREQRVANLERQHSKKRVLDDKMPPDSPPILLRVADAQRQRSEAELQQLRKTAEELAAKMQQFDTKVGIVTLHTS